MSRTRRTAPLPAVPLTLVLLLGALASAWGAETSSGLQGRTWALRGLGGELRAARGEVTLRLENGRVGGSGGINSYSADYKLEEGKLSLSALTSTKMAGEPALMAQEQAYFAALEKATGFGVEGYRLVLTDAEGKLLLLFEPRGVSETNRPLIHAPASGERIGPNVTVAGRTGSGTAGLINVTTEVYLNGKLEATIPGHRNATTEAGKYWLRVATPRPADAPDGDNALYVIRVVELDRQGQPRGPEAFVVLFPKR